MKEVNEVWRYIENNDISDLFPNCTKKEVFEYYKYMDSEDLSMSEYVRRIIINKLEQDDGLVHIKTTEQLWKYEKSLIKELERRTGNNRKNS